MPFMRGPPRRSTSVRCSRISETSTEIESESDSESESTVEELGSFSPKISPRRFAPTRSRSMMTPPVSCIRRESPESDGKEEEEDDEDDFAPRVVKLHVRIAEPPKRMAPVRAHSMMNPPTRRGAPPRTLSRRGPPGRTHSGEGIADLSAVLRGPAPPSRTPSGAGMMELAQWQQQQLEKASMATTKE